MQDHSILICPMLCALKLSGPQSFRISVQVAYVFLRTLLCHCLLLLVMLSSVAQGTFYYSSVLRNNTSLLSDMVYSHLVVGNDLGLSTLHFSFHCSVVLLYFVDTDQCSFYSCHSIPTSEVDNNNLFDSLDNSFKKVDAFCNQILDNNKDNTFSTTCSVCSRKSKNKHKLKKLIPCQTCYSLVHRPCTEIPLHDLLNFSATDYKYWECKTCTSDKFPLNNIDISDFSNHVFNSNFDCNCKTSTIPNINSFNFKRFQYTHITQDNENLPKKKKIFSIFHSNIQSLMQNFDDLELLLNNLGDHQFDVIALSETWNPESKITFMPGILNGYHEYKGTPGQTIKGGCGLYIKK